MRNKLNLQGKRFGKLVALEYAYSKNRRPKGSAIKDLENWLNSRSVE